MCLSSVLSFMAKSIFIFLFLLLFLFLSTNPVLSQLNNGFVYNGFKGFTNNISLNGVAKIHNNGLLQLTNKTLRLISHTFYPTPIRFKNSTTAKALSFFTAFSFAIVPKYKKLGGHGLAFTISSTKEPIFGSSQCQQHWKFLKPFARI